MRNAWLLAINTLKQTARKKGTLIILLVLPVIGVLVAMAAYGSIGSSSVTLGVVDQDHSNVTGDLVKSLDQEGQFKILSLDEQDIETYLTAGKVDSVLIIPQGFAESITNGSITNGTGDIKENLAAPRLVSIKGEAATAWVQNYTNLYLQNLQDLSQAAGGNGEVFEALYHKYQEKNVALTVNKVQDQTKSKGMTTQSIGFLIMFMMLGAGTTADMILKEKRNRTYYRICAAPVSPRTYVLGNVMANLFLVLIQIILTLFLMSKVLRIETFVPLPELFLILMLFGLVAIGLGLIIVAFANDSVQAGTLQTLIITPTCMLSGCFWPLAIMPKSVQRIAEFLPQTWAIAAIEKLQAGSAFSQVGINLAIILAFALAFFLIAAYRFGKNNEVKTFI